MDIRQRNNGIVSVVVQQIIGDLLEGVGPLLEPLFRFLEMVRNPRKQTTVKIVAEHNAFSSSVLQRFLRFAKQRSPDTAVPMLTVDHEHLNPSQVTRDSEILRRFTRYFRYHKPDDPL